MRPLYKNLQIRTEQRWRHLPLRLKLMLPVLAVNSLIAVGLFFAVWQSSTLELENRLVNDADLVAHTVQSAAQSIPSKSDQEAFLNAIAANEERIDFLVIVDATTGEVIEASDSCTKEMASIVIPFWESLEARLRADSPVRAQPWFHFSKHQLQHISPLVKPDETSALDDFFVLLALDTSRPRREVLERARNLSIAVMFALVSLSTCVALLLHLVVIRRVRKITKATPHSHEELISYQNPLLGDDEICRLAKSVDSAYGKLRTSFSQLKSSAEQLSTTGKLARVGSWSLVAGEDSVRCCDQALKIHGRDTSQEYEELSVDGFVELYAEHDRATLKNAIELACTLGQEFDLQLQVNSNQLDAAWVRVVGHATREADQIVAVHGAVQDVTSFRSARDAALKSEKKHRLIAKCADIGTWDWNIDSNQVEFSDRWCQLIGSDRYEIGADFEAWEERVHPEDRAELRSRLNQHFDDQQPFQFEHRLRHKDGSWTWVYSAGRVYERDAQNEPLRMAGIHLDITERKRLDAQALRHQKQNELIVETVAHSIVFTDAEFRVTGWNRRSEDLFEFAFSEASGQSVFDLIFDSHNTPEQIGFGRVLEGIASSKSGAEIPIEYSIKPITIEQECSFLIIITDISNRQEQIRKQRMESIGTLASGISHEVQMPLEVAGEYVREIEQMTFRHRRQLKAFEQRLLDDQFKDIAAIGRWWRKNLASKETAKIEAELPIAIQETQACVQRATQIVQAVHDISRDDSEEQLCLNINSCVNNIITICSNHTQDRIEVVTDFEKNLPEIPCHPTEISQIILNLALNSIDAVSERFGDESLGRIVFATRLHRGGVLLRIEDNGVGISPELQQRVFEPFFTTKSEFLGTGQGLPLCRTLVEHHGGTIEVDSVPGEGATFQVWLPPVATPVVNEQVGYAPQVFGQPARS